MSRVEEKLFQNRYRVDEDHPHITIRDPSLCATRCHRQQCVVCCPAACYSKGDNGRVVLEVSGCLECGTCRLVCNELMNVEWNYPRGGFGILYKFG